MTAASIFTTFVISVFAVAMAASLNFACADTGLVASVGGEELAAASSAAAGCIFLIF